MIYLHIGLHKTATTSLQYHIFPNLSGISFLGRGKGGVKGSQNLYIALSKYVHSPIIDSVEEDTLRKAFLEVEKSTPNLLISDEWFTADYSEFYGFDGCPWQEKLAKLSRVFSDFAVKLLVTLRRPFEALYSQYCEFCGVGIANKYPEFVSYLRESNDAKVFQLDWFDDLVRKCFQKSELVYLDFALIVNNEFEATLQGFFDNIKFPAVKIPRENAKRKTMSGTEISEDSFVFAWALRSIPAHWLPFISRFHHLKKILVYLRTFLSTVSTIPPLTQQDEIEFFRLFPDSDIHYKDLCSLGIKMA